MTTLFISLYSIGAIVVIIAVFSYGIFRGPKTPAASPAQPAAEAETGNAGPVAKTGDATAAPPAAERTMGERVKEVLNRQGVPYEEDDKHTITFEWQFLHWEVVDTGTPDFFRLDLGFGSDHDVNDTSFACALFKRVNNFNKMYRMGKIVLYDDAILFTAQTFVTPGCDLNILLIHALRLLVAMKNDFFQPDTDTDEDEDDGTLGLSAAHPASPSASLAVDHILEKVKAVGYDHLTDDEKAALLGASGNPV